MNVVRENGLLFLQPSAEPFGLNRDLSETLRSPWTKEPSDDDLLRMPLNKLLYLVLFEDGTFADGSFADGM